MRLYVSKRRKQFAVLRGRCPQAKNALRSFLQVVVFVLAAPICAAQTKVTDTDYEIIPRSTPSLHWVDDNRLLFVGIKRADMHAAIAAKEADRVTRLKKLYLWDDTARSARLYADAQEVCFANGFVSYRVRVDRSAGKEVLRVGALGSEKELERPLSPRDAIRSNITCKVHFLSQLRPPPPRTRKVVVLRDGDGYLDTGPSESSRNYFEERKALPRNLTLYRPETGKAISLPMTWEEEIAGYEIAYSEYRRAYVLRPRMPVGSPLGRVTSWPKGQPLVAYLLWADGRVESTSVPYFFTPGLGDPRPTKAGWHFGGGYFREVGLYLFDGKNMSKLDTGAEREIAVSPDGCKAAVGIQNRHLEMGTPFNFKIFRLCPER